MEAVSNQLLKPETWKSFWYLSFYYHHCHYSRPNHCHLSFELVSSLPLLFPSPLHSAIAAWVAALYKNINQIILLQWLPGSIATRPGPNFLPWWNENNSFAYQAKLASFYSLRFKQLFLPYSLCTYCLLCLECFSLLANFCSPFMLQFKCLLLKTFTDSSII